MLKKDSLEVGIYLFFYYVLGTKEVVVREIENLQYVCGLFS